MLVSGHCQLFMDVEATTKILEVAGLLGRSSGLYNIWANMLYYEFWCTSRWLFMKIEDILYLECELWCWVVCSCCQHDNFIPILMVLLLQTGLAVVDCSASSETVGLLKQVIIPGCCLILANKKPLTCAIVSSSMFSYFVLGWSHFFVIYQRCIFYWHMVISNNTCFRRTMTS